MTYKVKINKETGLGEAENPYPKLMERTEFNDERVSNIDWVRFDNLNLPLHVYDQNNNQVKDGEFECEKVWQVNIPGYEEYRDLKQGETVEIMKSLNRSTRQIYRVVKQEEAETVEAHPAPDEYWYPNRAVIEIRDSAANEAKSKTIDEVAAILNSAISIYQDLYNRFHDANISKVNVLKEVLTEINNLK